MSADLGNALNRLAERGDERGSDAVMVAAREEIASGRRIVAAPTMRPRYSLPGFVVAVTAAAVVAVVVGSVGWWAATRSDDGATVTDTQAISTTLPASTTVESSVVSSSTETPQAVDDAPLTLPWTFEEVILDGGWFWDVAVSEAGTYALSTLSTEDGEGPGISFSVDTVEWTTVALPIDSNTGCGWLQGWSEAIVIESGPPGLIVVGRDECNGTAWISTDGITWERVVHDEWLGNPEALRSVTAGGPGWVAVGADLKGNAVVWISPDGTTWQRVIDDDLNKNPGSRVDMWDVKAGGPGLVAVGFEGFEASDNAASAVWTSVDGTDWTRLPKGTIGGAGLFYLSVDPDTGHMVTFARQSVAGNEANAWTSTDGQTWTQSTNAAAEAPAHAIWLDGDTILAASRGQDGGNPALWLTQDAGSTWHRLTGPETNLNPSNDYGMFTITWIGDRILIAGQCDDCSGMWIGESTDR